MSFARYSVALVVLAVYLKATNIHATLRFVQKECAVKIIGHKLVLLNYGYKCTLAGQFQLDYSCLPMFSLAHHHIAQKMKFSIKDFFSKCDQIRSFGFGHIY